MKSANHRIYHRILHKLFLKTPKSQTNRHQLIWWLIAIIYLYSIGLFFFGPLMRLNRFDCVTNRPPSCPDFILPELNKLQGQLIYQLNLTDLSSRFKHNLPAAEKVNLLKVWPNQLIADIYWQSPITNLQIPASSSAVLVGANGYIIEAVDKKDSQLPTITASAAADFVVSDYLVDESLMFALDIVKSLPQIDNSTVASIQVISPLELRVINQNQDRYLFTSTKPITNQLHALQLILAQSTINISDPVYDLRYERPALKQSW